MESKKRWLKVELSYREAEKMDQWNAVVLGATSMLVEIENAEASVVSPIIADLSLAAENAALELILRTERLAPPARESAA
jgi:hypothetical protein